MAELTAQSVEDYTQGRLESGDDETQRLLAAALGAARRYCGWHVAPSRTDELILDGPGSSLLVLPTLRLTAITELIECGVSVDVATLEWSPRGVVRKRGYWLGDRGWWADRLGAIHATITHGFDDAPEWQAAVLSVVDRWSDLPTGGRPNVVGPVQWPTREAAAGVFTLTERSILDMYALESAP